MNIFCLPCFTLGSVRLVTCDNKCSFLPSSLLPRQVGREISVCILAVKTNKLCPVFPVFSPDEIFLQWKVTIELVNWCVAAIVFLPIFKKENKEFHYGCSLWFYKLVTHFSPTWHFLVSGLFDFYVRIPLVSRLHNYLLPTNQDIFLNRCIISKCNYSLKTYFTLQIWKACLLSLAKCRALINS